MNACDWESGRQWELIVRFDHKATDEFPYMYHCHILEHEDRDMMGQFTVAQSYVLFVSPVFYCLAWCWLLSDGLYIQVFGYQCYDYLGYVLSSDCLLFRTIVGELRKGNLERLELRH